VFSAGSRGLVMSDQPDEDIFQLNGRVRPDVTDEATSRALRDSLGHARSTNWDSVRTPHVFMGLLGTADVSVCQWADRLGADTARLLDQFRDLFYQDAAPVPPLVLNREFLSDNVIRVLRESYARCQDLGRDQITPMDLLITLFTTHNSIVAECFERIGVTAARLTELAVSVEQDAP
jgi:ATP-dependent Clp protease ATP-binding subunit ClpA